MNHLPGGEPSLRSCGYACAIAAARSRWGIWASCSVPSAPASAGSRPAPSPARSWPGAAQKTLRPGPLAEFTDSTQCVAAVGL